jgi:hypothetical protein
MYQVLLLRRNLMAFRGLEWVSHRPVEWSSWVCFDTYLLTVAKWSGCHNQNSNIHHYTFPHRIPYIISITQTSNQGD